MVSESPEPDVLGNTSESGVTDLPTHKHKWTQEENRMLWKCYFESDKNVRGYMERMHRLWIERGGSEMSKQRLRTQVQNIGKKKLLSDVEIGEIVGAGRPEDDADALNEESDEVDGDLEVSIEEEQNIRTDVAEVCVSVERSVDVCWRGKEIRLLKDEEKKILRRLREVMLISEKTQLPSLRKVNVKELKETVELVNTVIHNVITNSITEMNDLLYAGAYVVAEKLGKRKKKRTDEKRKEPWWKTRIQANIAEWRNNVSRLDERRKRTFEFEKKDLDRMERTYRLSDMGNVQVIDMLKEKISAGATKIRRYKERELHYHQNPLFATNQKQFYQELDGGRNIPNKAPDAQEASEFWSNIWSIRGNFKENASWLPKVKERLSEIDKQEDIRISVENVKTAIRKMTNWKVPGPDCVQGYWFKRFSSLHSRLTEHL